MTTHLGDREFGSWLEGQSVWLQPGLFAVDLGCGIGDDTYLMTEAGLTVVGLDRSIRRVSQAARRAPCASFVVADLTYGIPILAATADLVTASLSLHYFDRRTTDRILGDLARVMKPGAVLLCRVNVIGERQALWGTGIEHEPDFFEVEPGRFKRFFSAETLAEALQPHLAVEDIRQEETRVLDEHYKKTLVARARRQA